MHNKLIQANVSFKIVVRLHEEMGLQTGFNGYQWRGTRQINRNLTGLVFEYWTNMILIRALGLCQAMRS